MFNRTNDPLRCHQTEGFRRVTSMSPSSPSGKKSGIMEQLPQE
jgi:hypothetical protein